MEMDLILELTKRIGKTQKTLEKHNFVNLVVVSTRQDTALHIPWEPSVSLPSVTALGLVSLVLHRTRIKQICLDLQSQELFVLPDVGATGQIPSLGKVSGGERDGGDGELADVCGVDTEPPHLRHGQVCRMLTQRLQQQCVTSAGSIQYTLNKLTKNKGVTLGYDTLIKYRS